MTASRLTRIQLDRAAGALLGLVAGDALGAPYEFTSSPEPVADLVGGGTFGWAPGEWTDDTQMAICVAEVTATGVVDVDAIGQRFLAWLHSGPTDVGISTRAVLASVSSPAELPDAARRYYERHPRGAAGNGSLMRTAPVALAHLGDDDAIAAAATEVSMLTHGDPLAGEGCVLWCVAIDRGVREERLDGVRDALDLLPASSRDRWAPRLSEAESQPAASFSRNGFVVTALQAAYASIRETPVPDDAPPRHLEDALMTAVRVGGDTDTVAAIAGQLLGARWGASAVPSRWRDMLHGWPGYRADDLVRLADLTVRGGRPDGASSPGSADLDEL
ncbi:MAG: ADP-ribosylglycohydrolase family protein [Actinobacteria bacterium]|nr:ADP-ribosylglycohydrolase family protein [Actinomycetota bacterium]